mgnify:CR=1 FL=1|jgi:hypothetical protein
MGPCCASAPTDNQVSRGAVTTNNLLQVHPDKLVLSKRGSGKEVGGGSFKYERSSDKRGSLRGGRPSPNN